MRCWPNSKKSLLQCYLPDLRRRQRERGRVPNVDASESNCEESRDSHARPPAWLANVKDRSKFLIADGAEATAATSVGGASKSRTAVKKTSRSVSATAGKGQRKGPQPALYRDPKSGATWGGRGPAPTWLSGSKDRTRFLIDGAVAVDAKPAVTKAVAKNAPAAKKTAAKKAVSAKCGLRKQ
ncbi:H-NS family nucleoid-associated regulatory protein [Paraburkholderia sp. BL18I3N2]|uniref:H-NS family nucleoid-associated regulatory protein n=1 Tax=Paraburkholderia sp. BL18I3N2 TaxID=1938799 RepID=UPI00280AD8B5|nr:H-NS family nucleoid-associated regulatory protein [Paraburkholderia sp. BL18I3N2]